MHPAHWGSPAFTTAAYHDRTMTEPLTVIPPAPAEPTGRAVSCVLVDLDGTITDSAPGITAALVTTFLELERPVPTDLMAWVGPPILDSFRDFAGMDEAESREALVVYRRHYRAGGAYDNAVFPGVAGMLSRVHAAGVPLSLATSKPESQATLILEHFGLAQYFDVICGASEDEVRSAKADVVEEALRRLTADGVDTSHAVMVGDRHYDVEGAAANGVPTILVEWGYGSPAEAEGAFAVVHTPEQLLRILLGR